MATVYDQAQDLGLFFDRGISKHCGALAAAVDALLRYPEIESIRELAREILRDFNDWKGTCEEMLPNSGAR